MKKKKLFAFLVFLLLIFCGYFLWLNIFNKDNIKEEQTGSTPIIYKVTKEGSNNTIYLFGSIHIADKSAYPLSDAVINAYNDSDYLAVEFDLVEFQKNQEAQFAMLQEMIYTDGTKINDHLSQETYNKLVDYLEKNSTYSTIYDVYKPFFFLLLVNDTIYKKANLNSTGIDEYLLKQAKKDSKEILEVETYEEQYDLLLTLNDELYELMFKSMLDNIDANVFATKLLYNAWKSGNYNLLVRYSGANGDDGFNDSYNNEEEIELINDYNQKIMYDRNLTMKEKLIEYFNEDKKVLFTVGCAHVIGDQGIAKLLENEGYKVELIK